MHNNKFENDILTSIKTIYTPSIFARTNLLHLQEIGITISKKNHQSSRDNLNSFLFFIVENGTGILEYNKKSHTLKIGDCVFIDCNNYYSHISTSEKWKINWIHFYGPNIKNLYDKFLDRGGQPVFQVNNKNIYISILKQIYDIANSSDYIKDMKINSNIYLILSHLMEECWSEERVYFERNSKQNIESIKNYLDENYMNKITLDLLSEQFYINKYYLTRLFKEQYGMTIIEYLVQIRITKAKKLLRFSDLSIEDISLQCGINDPNYFSRLFKKVEQCNPIEYRMKW